jgi:hypothetical protein
MSCHLKTLYDGWSPENQGTYCLHLQSRKIVWPWNQRESKWKHAGFLLIFSPWRWKWYVPPKRQLTLNGLHGVIYQKIVFLITTAVRTSNHTSSYLLQDMEAGETMGRSVKRPSFLLENWARYLLNKIQATSTNLRDWLRFMSDCNSRNPYAVTCRKMYCQYVRKGLPVAIWKELNPWYSCSYGTSRKSFAFRNLKSVIETCFN